MNKLLYILLFSFLSLTAFSQIETSWETPFSQNEKKADVTIYPNPCNQPKIKLTSKNVEISEVRIYNIAGIKVFYKKLETPQKNYKLNVSEIPNGIYLIHIKAPKNKHITKKLIISH